MNVTEHADSRVGKNTDCLALKLVGNVFTTMSEGIKDAIVTAGFSYEDFTFPSRILCVCLLVF